MEASRLNEQIIKAIRTIAEQAINKAGFDKTRNGQILKQNKNNTYKVKIDGIDYDNIPSYGDQTFIKGDVVKICIPNNQPSQMYIIPMGGDGGTPPPTPTESDKTFVYEQQTTFDSWRVVHNLGKYPSVSIVSYSGNEVVGDVQYINENECILTFSVGVNGKAYFN